MSRREFFSYDGTLFIGRVVVDEKTGATKAFDAVGRSLGKFDGYDVARRAVSNAYSASLARRAASAKALEYVNRLDVDFASGMPAHFLGRRC